MRWPSVMIVDIASFYIRFLLPICSTWRQGSGKIFSSKNTGLQEWELEIPMTALTTLFWFMKTSLLDDDVPQKIRLYRRFDSTSPRYIISNCLMINVFLNISNGYVEEFSLVISSSQSCLKERLSSIMRLKSWLMPLFWALSHSYSFLRLNLKS